MKRGLIALLILATAACAGAQMEPYINIYFINGVVADAPAIPPGSQNGHYAYFHNVSCRDLIGTTGLSGVNRDFAINAGLLSTLEAGRSYQVFVAPFDVGGAYYGAGPVSVPLSGKGSETVALTLAAGAGLIPPVDSLRIFRDGTSNDYKFSWNSLGGAVNVYRLTSSDATAYYSDDPSLWGVAPYRSFVGTISEYKVDDDQIALGSSVFKQAYYKVVLSEFDTSGLHNLAVSTAESVGKYDFAVYPGYNLASPSLYPTEGNTIDQAFFDQIRVNNYEVYQFNDSGKTYTKGSTDGTSWIYEGGTILISQGKSYWVYNPGSLRNISLLGKVKKESFARAMYAGYNLFGSPVAWNVFPFDSAGLPPTVATDEIYLFDNSSKTYPKLKVVGGAWVRDGGGLPFGLYPNLGYWYYNSSGSSFDWRWSP